MRTYQVSLAFLVSGQAQQALSFFTGFGSDMGQESPTHSFLTAGAGVGAGTDVDPPIF